MANGKATICTARRGSGSGTGFPALIWSRSHLPATLPFTGTWVSISFKRRETSKIHSTTIRPLAALANKWCPWTGFQTSKDKAMQQTKTFHIWPTRTLHVGDPFSKICYKQTWRGNPTNYTIKAATTLAGVNLLWLHEILSRRRHVWKSWNAMFNR